MWYINEFLCAVSLVLIAWYYFYRKNISKIKNVPGPTPNMFLGNLLDFLGPTTQFMKTLSRYTKTYGEVTKFHDGPFSTAVIISDYKLLEHVLSSTTIALNKAGQYEFFHNWLGTGLLTSWSSKWKIRRRLITPAFHFSILSEFVDVFERVGNIFIEKLKKETGKESVNIYPLVSLCTLDIICEAAMGTSVNAQTDGTSEYVRNVKKMCAIIVERVFSPINTIFYPITINYFREKQALKVVHEHSDTVIDQRIKSFQKNATEKNDHGIKKKMAFLDLLLQCNVDGQPLSRTDLREEVDTFMFEGHDTTSSAITFALYCLAAHPEVQKKVVDEQRTLFEDLKNAKVTVSDLQKMKYLDLVIKETLRLYPSVPYIGRVLANDLEWNGVRYPKGLNLLLFFYDIQRSPEYFPEPEKFIPERFEHYDGTRPFSYVPFSAGPRNCIGQKFAVLELKSTISKVVRNFELLPASPEHELQLAAELILISKNGICISLKERK